MKDVIGDSKENAQDAREISKEAMQERVPKC